MGSSRQARSYSWLGEASHFFYILCFHRQKGVFITIIEKIISFMCYFQKESDNFTKCQPKQVVFAYKCALRGKKTPKHTFHSLHLSISNNR